MFMPADYSWLEPVIVMSAIVFVVGLIGNILSFESRFGNALVTAVLFGVLAAALSFFLFPVNSRTIATPANLAWLEPVLVASAIVFLVDLIGNMLSFNNRLTNALATTVVFALLFGGVYHYFYNMGGVPLAPVAAPAAAPAPAPATP